MVEAEGGQVAHFDNVDSLADLLAKVAQTEHFRSLRCAAARIQEQQETGNVKKVHHSRTKRAVTRRSTAGSS